jgi:Alpha/beta hydrolase
VPPEFWAFPEGAASAEEAPSAVAADLATTWLAAGHVTVIVHGVNDDGKDWSLRVKDALLAAEPEGEHQEVYLFRWTGPDGGLPPLAHARNSVPALEAKNPDHPESEAAYQVEEARRLKDFIVGTRALFAEYGVDGRINVLAHSQGSLITLKALELGADVDNVVFLGSPLTYTGERQDDVADALPHVRGVLYNYYTPSDLAIRFMGGGLWCEPRGWPTKDLPPDKVVQTKLNVAGHTGYYTAEAIRANYVDELGIGPGEHYRLSAPKAAEFGERWGELLCAAGLLDPE